MDNLAFLDNEDTPVVPDAVEPVAETPTEPVAEQPEAKPEPARDENGRFKPKAEEPKPEPVMVPLQALHETRDEVKALRAKLEQLQQPQEQPKSPDIFEDPEGYQAHLSSQFEQKLYQQTLAISQRFAEQQHGKEAVDQALAWGVERCNADPHFNAQVKSSPDPVGFAIEQYRRDQIASQVDLSEFQKFQAWQAAQAATQPAPVAETPPPPRSLASLPSSGGAAHVPTGPGQAFDTLFNP